ncbi:phosphoribosylamine-glycine ligase [Bartonella bacilliformis str. Heidi Mejia]|uniref:Phosphoribosylamine--glycine ligase n=2 Tax=Bartonella bacilliformis TaxID=774 RepID=A1URV8_BARBK|nr:phosphoribosylamine--glycine ligase [Bartonella bacilliformis]ABM45258.1 phosphoribosylamine--glycine ligase [Bartonella bacilliformis KC583]AMG85555.1 phosphoribosylamine--glycine ligase [Bartonella bacilliformis]EKS44964.1 phosphoribosylamine--glycine ligase [Bartonella bacilliformis INS]EYS90154.1 phosphoribosylamine-glycine ligase [Bartonella bacilliformis San Pedro600-02]EYS92318.1 phosphoribosylamine-glycine ligase [Bartonella bacilliformis str. Heidi Mejia]
MNVLLIGSGGREHALAWKIAASPLLTKLYCAPGNPATIEFGENIVLDIDDHLLVIDFCKTHSIDLVIIGPEAPLISGITDALNAADIYVFGPNQKAAQLEGSKSFTKDLCQRNNIPTSIYQCFDDASKAKSYIRQQGVPIVIKVDGLAAGKGVVIATTIEEAFNAVDSCFEGAFGDAGKKIVIEAFLEGEEASFFCLCDGKTAIPFGSAQDHKRVGDGDIGENTGGMGAYSPAPVMTEEMVNRTLKEIIEPALRGMAEMEALFKGILFAGLMITSEGPKLIEFNVRFGDPECQVLMMRLEEDILPLLLAAAQGNLENRPILWSEKTALTVVMAANGYPNAPQKGSVIRNVDKVNTLSDVQVFHSGTALHNGELIANGGRVLNITAVGKTVSKAQKRAYEAVDCIDWPQGFVRRDIGWRAIARES